MSSSTPSAADAAGGAGGGGLSKGGKPKVQHDKARSAFTELMSSRLEELIASRAAYSRPEDRAFGACVVLSIEGNGYQAPDGSFSAKKPGKTKGKSSHHYDERSFLEQFYVTVGHGPGFERTSLCCVSNPVFFKDGEGPGTKKPKILGGHDPIIKPGDFVFMREASGSATVTTVAGSGRWSGCTEQSAIRYCDLFAVLPKEDLKEWTAKGLQLRF
jgi:hypothetical protein